MQKHIGKRMGAVILALSVLFAANNTTMLAAEEDAVVVLPIYTREGEDTQYYGQTFEEPSCILTRNGEELSNDTLEDLGWKLELDSNEVGEHHFRLVQLTDETEPVACRLDENAPTYTIKEYRTTAAVDEPEIQTSRESVNIQAPAGYEISGEKVNGVWNWSTVLATPALEEGKNEISYYLRSANKKDGTLHAIDQTRKTITIEVDSISPEITELTGIPGDVGEQAFGTIKGSESAMYYYTVLPESFEFDLSTEEAQGAAIKKIYDNVQTHYGISGYGRVDGVKASEFSFANLLPSNNYIVYAFLCDAAGNVSLVKSSQAFTTKKMTLVGSVDVSGTVAVDQTMTAKPGITSDDPGTLTYQWYRMKVAEDEERLNEEFDETGGAAEDDLEAEDDEEEDDDDEDEEEDEDEVEEESIRSLAENADAVDISSMTPIPGATSSTYKITKDDIGYRIGVSVQASNYAASVSGVTETFVPKLMPTYTMPAVASAVYSPTRQLSSIKLSAQWSWVDTTITPVYGNSGYRARFTPSDTRVYKTVVVRVKVPITKKSIKASMFTVAKKKAYKGAAIKGNYSAKDGKKALTKLDVKVTYKNNKKLGKATITFKGIGNYKGTVKKTYKIVRRSVKSVQCTYAKNKNYTSRNVYAGLVLKNDGVKMVLNKDYQAIYKNNVQIGTAQIIIKGIGNYCGRRVLKFAILPKRVKITKVKKNKTSFKVNWKEDLQANGYNIYISTTKSFKKGTVQEFSTKGSAFGIKGLKKKSKYYVRIKSYKVRKGKTYQSFYSPIKTIKL